MSKAEQRAICRADAVVEGLPLAVAIPGLPPLAVFRVGAVCYVTANQCTHGRAKLTDGAQQGATIYCPLHGGAFDVTTGDPLIPPCTRELRVYDACIREGRVYISSGPD